MFELRKDMQGIEVSSSQVRRLYRSLGDVQIALPGYPSQQATAYLCAYVEGKGFRVAVALHLHVSEKVAYYLNPKGSLNKDQVRKTLEEGIFFAETMGFMLGDLDYHRLDPEAKEELWSSLPMTVQADSESAEGPLVGTGASEPEAQSPVVSAEGDSDSEDEDWLDLSGLSSIQMRKKAPPTPAELQNSKKEFLQNLGRLLSSF